MATITVTLTGVAPYDGSYDLDLAETELRNREWNWIKQFSGYLPATFDDAIRGGDAAFWCAVALILLHRRGKITKAQAPDVFELLEDAPYSAIGVKIDAGEGDDAGPPPRSSNGNEPTHGPSSSTSSETPETPPIRTGPRPLDTSVSAPTTSAS